MLKEMILNSQLPSDDELLAKLVLAHNSRQQPATLIGTMIESGIQNNSTGLDILKRYPKTIEFLSNPTIVQCLIKHSQ